MKTPIILFTSTILYFFATIFFRGSSYWIWIILGGAVIVACIWTYFTVKMLWETSGAWNFDIFGIEERNELLREIRDELKNKENI